MVKHSLAKFQLWLIQPVGHLPRYGIILLYLLSWALLTLNSQVGLFSDEADNWLGGMYLLEGKTLYSDYATQHAPFAYYVGAFVSWIARLGVVRGVWQELGLGSADDYGLHRLIWAQLQWGVWVALHRYLKKTEISGSLPWFALLMGLVSIVFWTHLLLAETIVAYAGAVGVFILLGRVLPQGAARSDIYVMAIVSMMMPAASLVYIFLGAWLMGVVYLYVLRDYWRGRTPWVDVVVPPLLWVGVPIGYFVIEGNYSAFYREAIEFNSLYYTPYLADISASNRLRLFEIILAFLRRATQTLSFVSQPAYAIEVGLLSVSLVVIVMLIIKKHTWHAIVLGACLILASNPRVASARTNADMSFHLAPFYVIGLAVAVYGLVLFHKEKQWQRGMRLGLGVYLLASLWALPPAANRTFESYQYLLTQPEGAADPNQPWWTNRSTNLRSAHAQYATLFNKLLDSDEWVWMGGFQAEDILFLEPQFASPYTLYLPWHADSPELNQALILELDQHQPQVIYFDFTAYYWNVAVRDHAHVMAAYLDANYIQVTDPLPHLFFLAQDWDDLNARMATLGYWPMLNDERDWIFQSPNAVEVASEIPLEMTGEASISPMPQPSGREWSSLEICFADYAFIYLQMRADKGIDLSQLGAHIHYTITTQAGLDSHVVQLTTRALSDDTIDMIYRLDMLPNMWLTNIRLEPLVGGNADLTGITAQDFRLVRGSGDASQCQPAIGG